MKPIRHWGGGGGGTCTTYVKINQNSQTSQWKQKKEDIDGCRNLPPDAEIESGNMKKSSSTAMKVMNVSSSNVKGALQTL